MLMSGTVASITITLTSYLRRILQYACFGQVTDYDCREVNACSNEFLVSSSSPVSLL